MINPTQAQMEYSDLDLVLSGHSDGVNMIEVGAAEISEADMLKAIEFGYEEGIKPILEMQVELMEKAGAAEKRLGNLSLPPQEVWDAVVEYAGEEMKTLRRIKGKQERNEKIGELRERMFEECFAMPTDGSYPDYKAAEERRSHAREAFRTLEKKTTRSLVVNEQIRADGRAIDEVRPLHIETSLFPRTHGTSLFQRGETQSIVTCVLGTGRDEQIVDGLMPEYAKKFYLHYNFPPFCTGEAKPLRGTSRRELGHGALAERALRPMMPDHEDFPYTIRIVSDITESNGSSSMASVCGASLAMMDAGVPTKAPVAGIAMGLIKEGDKYAVLSDITGTEDHLGDMDFKVTGTREGVTAFQMDTKIKGVTAEIMTKALMQAREGRIHILNCMEEVIATPREELSEWAPRIHTLQIKQDRIRDLIGPGGKTIKSIQAESGATVNVEDSGVVTISSVDGASCQLAIKMVREITQEAEVGKLYLGIVKKVVDFGAFVEIFTGTDGLVHISELAQGRVDKVTDILMEGDEVLVKCIEVDKSGKIRLSRKAALGESLGGGGTVAQA